MGHCFLITLPTIPTGQYGYFLRVAINPQPMVLLFFVLSGFVLGCMLDKSPVTDARTYQTYMVRRFFRLAPASWFSTFFAILIPIAATSWIVVGKSLLFLEAGPNRVLWTMQVELIASAFMPLLYWLTRKCGPVPNVIAIAVFVGVSMHPSIHIFLQFFAFFHAGLLISHIPQRITDRITPALGGLLCVVAVAAFLWLPDVLVGRDGNKYSMWQSWLWADVLPTALLVYLVVIRKSGPLNSLLGSPVAGFMGRISFGMYLLHLPILYLMFRTTSDIPTGLLRATVVFLATAAITIPLAAMLHRFLEVPFMKLGHRLSEVRKPVQVGESGPLFQSQGQRPETL